jgi:hypothetical protein
MHAFDRKRKENDAVCEGGNAFMDTFLFVLGWNYKKFLYLFKSPSETQTPSCRDKPASLTVVLSLSADSHNPHYAANFQ